MPPVLSSSTPSCSSGSSALGLDPYLKVRSSTACESPGEELASGRWHVHGICREKHFLFSMSVYKAQDLTKRISLRRYKHQIISYEHCKMQCLVTDLTSAEASRHICLRPGRKSWVKLFSPVMTESTPITSTSRWSCWAALDLTKGDRLLWKNKDQIIKSLCLISLSFNAATTHS